MSFSIHINLTVVSHIRRPQSNLLEVDIIHICNKKIILAAGAHRLQLPSHTSAFLSVPMYSLAQSSRLLLGSTELRVRGMSPKDEVGAKRLRQQTDVVAYFRAIPVAVTAW